MFGGDSGSEKGCVKKWELDIGGCLGCPVACAWLLEKLGHRPVFTQGLV